MEALEEKKIISLRDIWNESLIRTDREPVAREYLWASQLSHAPIDIWLALRGTPHSNVPNERSKRKFMSGSFHEHMVSMAMMRAGVMTERQDEVWTNFDIAVKGRGDFVLTGKFNFDQAVGDIKRMMLPKEMEEMFLKICSKMREVYDGCEIEPSVFEIKSVAEMTMTRIEKIGKPLESHILQTCHYKIGRQLNDGVVAVLCRDDLRLFEYHVTKADEKRYVERVNELAAIVKSNKQPPLEEQIIFDEVMGKFSKNLKIEYSNFLTLMFPQYERPDMYSDAVKPMVAKWNRVLARLKKVEVGEKTKPSKKFPDGKLIELTPKNIEAIEEMKQHGWDAKALAKVADVSEDEEEEIA